MMAYLKHLFLLTTLLHLSCMLSGQNLLINGGLEADWPNQLYPTVGQNLLTYCPYPWMDYNPNVGGDEAWFVGANNSQSGNPYLLYCYYSPIAYHSSAPWDTGASMSMMSAYQGDCFVGLAGRANNVQREGVQTRLNDCGYNSGEYIVSYYWSRTYQSSLGTVLNASLHPVSSTDRRVYDHFEIGADTYIAGTWDQRTANFELKMNRSTDMGNRWFSITGGVGGFSDYNSYTYIDDIQLYRPCDNTNACWPGTGQICPTVAIQLPPVAPFKLYGIDNATELDIRIFDMHGRLVIDTTHINYNGLPDFYWQGEILAGGGVASGQYTYEITLRNLCGGYKKDGVFTVQNGIYDSIPAWVDSTADWTTAPVPCCLRTLTLENKIIHGDVCFLVQDSILIRDNVYVTPGSDVLIQAPAVDIRDSVEFDGNVSDVTIVEGPCVGCRLAGDPAQAPQRDGLLTDAGPGSILPYVESQEPESNTAQQIAETVEAPPAGDPSAQPRLSVFPNPTDGAATLALDLPAGAAAHVRLHDALLLPVREVATQTALPAGRHTWQLDLADLPAGIYLVRVQVGETVLTEKVVRR
jgi:hypothetical protein